MNAAVATETHDATTGELIPAGATHVLNPMEVMMQRLGVSAIKQITRTVLQQVEGKPFAVTFEGAAYDGEELAPGKGSGVKMQPARIAHVLNLETGEKQALIMNTVLEGELMRNYGQNWDKANQGTVAKKGEDATGAYVGRSFIICGVKPTDAEGKAKRYRVYQIAEITLAGGNNPENVTAAEVVADASDPVARDGKSKPKG